jgi:hypothetical protein
MKKNQNYSEFSIQHDKRSSSVTKKLTELWTSSSWVSNSSAAVSVYSYRSQKMNFSSVWTTVTWTESLKESLSSFINIWDSANIRQAQWYIKLNVIAAFHKIQIAAEDK